MWIYKIHKILKSFLTQISFILAVFKNLQLHKCKKVNFMPEVSVRDRRIKEKKALQKKKEKK